MEIVEELMESERKYKELTDLLPQTIFEIDSEGRIVFANQIGFSTFGYSYEDFKKGLNAFQMFIPEEKTKILENMQRILRGERIGGVDLTALKKDGTTFPVLVFASPIIRADKSVGIRGIIIDNTERKHIEEELRKSEERYRLIVENANEMIAVVQDGIVKFANRRSLELTGYKEEDFLNKPFVNFIHPEDRAFVVEHHLKRLS
jgi:PAS domain S-box-containing protein